MNNLSGLFDGNRIYRITFFDSCPHTPTNLVGGYNVHLNRDMKYDTQTIKYGYYYDQT